VSEAVLLERSHAPARGLEIVDQDALQAVFMTEEMLSVDRVVELCGALPGIKSCILAHGAAVLASHNVPESIDLVSLSAHALEMLAAMRQSAARMGIGAVPAVTIHAEKGPITFFHQDDLCMLVMHKDRGFVPGVREKLQKVVEHLAQGDPALDASDSLPWAAKRPAT
jgi:predicted regulator of Ras-like GTPase activity (Roadblock/LC7/MglB family)